MATGFITLTAAAKRLGVSRTVIAKHVAGLGITLEEIPPAKLLTEKQYLSVQALVRATIDQKNADDTIALEVAAQRLNMSRVTLGKRMTALKIQSRRVGVSKRITQAQLARIEKYDQARSRHRPAKDALKREGI